MMAATVATFSCYAQALPDSTGAQVLKPQAGNVSTELNINPFNGSISLNNSFNQLKFRFFTAPNFALRLGVNANQSSSTNENSNPYGTNSYVYEETRSTTTFGLNMGIEKHFAGTRRLSPYIGADLAIVNKNSS